MTTVWLLRESFLAYERLLDVFATLEDAKRVSKKSGWQPIIRTLPPYLWDEGDPFFSLPGAESVKIKGSLFVVEPREVKS